MRNYPTFNGYGILTKKSDPDFGQPVLSAHGDDNAVITATLAGSPDTPTVYPAESITKSSSTGRITFISEGESYTIRSVREEDGYWLSKYKTYLPVEALNNLIDRESSKAVRETGTPDDSIDAFSSDDSVYVLGLIYTDSNGRWARIDGDWVMISPNDDTFNNMNVIPIDPEQADSYIDLYDKNFVTVADTEKYEAPSADDQTEE